MDILSTLAPPIMTGIGYALGLIANRKKSKADLNAVELSNTKEVIDFYKSTFAELQLQIKSLRNDIKNSSNENKNLKKQIEDFEIMIEVMKSDNVGLRKQIKELNDRLSVLIIEKKE